MRYVLRNFRPQNETAIIAVIACMIKVVKTTKVKSGNLARD